MEKKDRSLGELFSELLQETRTLIRQEIELARMEITRKISRAGKDAALMAGGLAVVYAGFLALVAGAIFGLGNVLPWWGSALVVAIS